MRMKKTKQQLEKITKYSIRKLTVGVGPVAIGAFLFGASTLLVDKVQANEIGGVHSVHYRYLAEQELTESEKALIHHEVPTEFQDEDIIYVVYRKKETNSQQLPYTGSKELALAGLGLATASLAVLLVSKKHRSKVLGILLISSIGVSNFVPFTAFAFENKELLSYNQTISASTHEGLAKGVIHIEGYEYVGYFKESKSSTNTSSKKGESVVEEPQAEYTGKIEAKGTQEPGKEGESLVQEPQSEYTGKIEAKGTQEPGKEGESLVQEPQSEYTGKIEAKGTQEPGKEGESLVQEPQAEYTGKIEAKGTQEPGKEGESLVQEPQSEYTSKIEAKGTQEPGKEGESLVQEKLPEYKVTEGAVTKETTTEIDYKTEIIEDPTKYTDEETVIQDGEKGSQITKTTYKTLDGIETDQVLNTTTIVIKEPVIKKISSGTKPIEGTLVEESLEKIPFKEKVEEDDQLKKGERVTVKEGKDGQKKVIKTYKTIKGLKTEEAPKVVEQVLELDQDRIVKLGTKNFEKPILSLSLIDVKDLKRTSQIRYNLENPSKATIKSITLTLKKGDEIVKTLTISPDNLTASLTDLQYYKDYKLETKMVYDRGEGDEEEVLREEPLRIDLKKVEVKNIKETSLISVDTDGVETDSSFLTSVPTDVKPYYLKIATHDNKVTRLAVDKIEEVTVDGKTLYKVTAKAPDLVQHTNGNELSEEYVHYFAKPKSHEENVYYDFNELVKAMQANRKGTFKLGADLNAANVPTPNKQYVPGVFNGHLTSVDGKQYTIHNIARPLFERIENASVKNINLGNVNINMPWAENIAPVARIVKNAVIENVKVTGHIIAKNDIAGVVNKLDGEGAKVNNVAFIGKIDGVGDKGWNLAGIVGEIWKGHANKTYVEADITATKARAAGLASTVDNSSDPNGIGKYGTVRNSVAKGTIKVKSPVDVGGFISKNWVWGKLENNVSMMKVENGEEFYGSGDIDYDGGYFTNNALERNFVVKDVSAGKHSFKYSRSHRIREISLEEANTKIDAMGITADKFEIKPLIEDTLNNTKSLDETYKDTQDYRIDRELAYRNIEKLQPFYNKEWIVNQANKLGASSNLVTKEVLSVTGLKNGQFVTDLSDIDKILIHYADGTKEELLVVAKDSSKVKQVKEYSIVELGEIVYTPNIVDKDRSDLIQSILEKLSPVELQSDTIYKHLNRLGDGKVNAIKNLYLEESFKFVKENLGKFITKLVHNQDHQLNTDEAAKRALIKKIDDNKAALLLGLSYLNRYYGIKFEDFNIKEIMLFKPDFYGKNVDVLDRIINIGSKENNIKGDRTHDAYREVISGSTGKGNLHEFLKYNMELFTSDRDLNDWFIKSTKDNVYIVEPKTTNPEFVGKKHRAYEGLNNDMHGKMILPLLNLKDAHMILISTYNTMAYSSFEKYGKNTDAERNAFKAEIDKVAKEQQNYLDFWSRLSLDKVRNQLLKSNNMVPTPVRDNQNYKGISTDRYGHTNKGKDVAPVREVFGPTGTYHDTNWNMGAVARVYANPYKDDSVFFMVTDMISDFGVSAFTHETTHVNDRMVYLGGSRHREGTDLEAFAQGMLQTPSVSNPNGEYKALGINMAYERLNDGNQWYNTNPNDLKSRDEIDRYMKGYNDTLMLLDYLEGEAVLNKASQELNNAWFKKVDRQYRGNNTKNQFDKVRPLSDEEKAIPLHTVDDLVTNNFMTNRGPGNRVYNPSDFDSAYVTVPMMTGIYGGNTSEGAPGAMSFKHNTFRIWGYYGYEKGFLGYASNKYKDESRKEGKSTLGDDYIIKKLSDNKFSTLEDWKKAYFNEVVTKAKNGIQSVEIDGTTYNSYEDLKQAFSAAVERDRISLKNGSVKFDNTIALKEKLFKKLLQQTDSFKTSIFK